MPIIAACAPAQKTTAAARTASRAIFRWRPLVEKLICCTLTLNTGSDDGCASAPLEGRISPAALPEGGVGEVADPAHREARRILAPEGGADASPLAPAVAGLDEALEDAEPVGLGDGEL